MKVQIGIEEERDHKAEGEEIESVNEEDEYRKPEIKIIWTLFYKDNKDTPHEHQRNRKGRRKKKRQMNDKQREEYRAK